jgi:hypothetical protein
MEVKMDNTIIEHDGEELRIYALSKKGVWLAIAAIDTGRLLDNYHFPLLLRFGCNKHLSMSRETETPDLETTTKSHSVDS